MASNLNALPTITATALGASLATGIAAGQYKAPTAVVGYTVPMDSLNFYVQTQDSTVLNVSATATGTNNSVDQINTWHKGAIWYLTVNSIAATCTIGVNILYKDPASGNYLAIMRASQDGFGPGNNGQTNILSTYPGGGSSGLASATGYINGQSTGQFGVQLPGTYRVQVSITATASGGGAAISYTVGQSKQM